MVNCWLPPYGTYTVPDGVMLPPVPADAVILGRLTKFAVTVMLLWTLASVRGFAVDPSLQFTNR